MTILQPLCIHTRYVGLEVWNLNTLQQAISIFAKREHKCYRTN